jgi:hypothetical protein
MALIGGLIAACILIACLLKAADIHKGLQLKTKIEKEFKAREAGNVDGEKSYAPWTLDQIANLNAYQMNNHFHPLTCPNRGDEKHPEIQGEKGRLLASQYGWVCPHCNYKQNWAHSFMTRRMVA